MSRDPDPGRARGGRGHVSTTPFDPYTFIGRYRPRHDPNWPRIAPFVRQVCLAAPPNSYIRTHRLLRSASMLANFCDERGIALTPDTALHPDTVAYFVEVALAGSKSAREYRGELHYLAKHNTLKAPWRPEQRLPGRKYPLAYSLAELTSLRLLARSQPTDLKRQAARAFLALGLGVGADGGWVARVGPEHVCEVGGALGVRVPDQDRFVPAWPAYVDELRDLAATVPTECLVGKASTSPNRVSSLVRQLHVPPGQVALSPSRLRATWKLEHLLAGTPLPYLLDLAGVQSLRGVESLLPDLRRRLEGRA